MIDPSSLPDGHHVRLQQALIESGKWHVVDRSRGFEAMKAEQNRLHRDEQDRYDGPQKWALWGKMYGVGGIVVASVQCQINHTWNSLDYNHCLENLSIVDATTGEVIAAASTVQDGEAGELYLAPPWDEAVEKLNNAYPKNFVPLEYTQRLKDYIKEAKETAPKPAAVPTPTPSEMPTVSYE